MSSPRSTLLKRERSDSELGQDGMISERLFSWQQCLSPKHRREDYDDAVAPLLKPAPGESKFQYFERLRKILPYPSRLSKAFDFTANGLYVYKRPVRSASFEHQLVLAQAGTVLHHVIVFVKSENGVKALEFGPAADDTGNSMDVTNNFLTEAKPGPVLVHNPESVEHEHLPMLHIDIPHHPLDADHILKALNFAARQKYQALRNNCIAFADFAVRVLTGNAIKNAPLLFDAVVGQVPSTDSPLLQTLQTMLQTTWHDITDGSRLMRAFLEEHGPHQIIPLSWESESKPADVASMQHIKSRELQIPSSEEDVGLAGADVSDATSGSDQSVAATAFAGCHANKPSCNMVGREQGRLKGVPSLLCRKKSAALTKDTS